MRADSKRISKYTSKIDGDVHKQRYDSQKDHMSLLNQAATKDLVRIEQDIKAMFPDVSTIFLPYYIIFAKEVYRIKNTHKGDSAANEICILANKWYSRGLSAENLNTITSFYTNGQVICITACDYPSEADVLKDVVYAFGTKTGTLEAGECDYPLESDVKDGVIYGGGLYEGTYACVLGLPKTGQTTSYEDYDDGYYEAGLPAGAGVRFVDNADGTITDNVTGLMWQKDGEAFNPLFDKNWSDAINYCEALTLAGHEDWRLANIKELMSIANYGTFYPVITSPFVSPPDMGCWSSTTYDETSDWAWALDLNDGRIKKIVKTDVETYARAVRGGQLNP